MVVKVKNGNHDYIEQGGFITHDGGCWTLVVLCPFDHAGLEDAVPALSSQSHSLCAPVLPVWASQ